VGDALTRGHYFFMDIMADGVELLSAPDAPAFVESQPLAPDVALAEAQAHYEDWIPSAAKALKGALIRRDQHSLPLMVGLGGNIQGSHNTALAGAGSRTQTSQKPPQPKLRGFLLSSLARRQPRGQAAPKLPRKLAQALAGEPTRSISLRSMGVLTDSGGSGGPLNAGSFGRPQSSA
jgi:hypothetical protein